MIVTKSSALYSLRNYISDIKYSCQLITDRTRYRVSKESCSNRKQFSKTLCRFLLYKSDKDVRVEKDFKNVGTVEEIIG